MYSVPAFVGEWYSRQMYREGTAEFEHHVATYGPQSEFGYKDFIPEFRMQDYDPDGWAALFRRAGAQYVVPVAEHHDGYVMYRERSDPVGAPRRPARTGTSSATSGRRSSISRWCSAPRRTGPSTGSS